MAQVLGVTRPPTRMDSQAKYCALARGDGGVYLRMPVGTGYREKIWVSICVLSLFIIIILKYVVRTMHQDRYL